MKNNRTSLPFLSILLFLPILSFSQNRSNLPGNKQAAVNSIQAHKKDFIKMSDEIWALAETAFEEQQSAKILADYAEQQGFKVERGVADIPTAFIASYGSGKPIIGVLGEFDALPGLSQKTTPEKNPLHEGKAGHGCGHNLFGVGSLGAAIAVKELMEQGKLKGTVRFYGTPAEEKFFGKLFIARAGLFDDLDACLDWHPSAKTKANVQSSLALVDFIVEFYGQAAHASSDPWNGRSAVDGLELYTTGLNYMREHVKPTVRIHYQIMNGGAVVNVVPDYAKLWVRIRDTKKEGMEKVWKRADEMIKGAAIMADVDYKTTLVSGLHEVLVNRTGGEVLQKNLELLGPITYTDEEVAFAKKIQEATDKPQVGLDAEIKELEETKENPGGGSTDVGDVSWLVPEIRLGVTTAPVDTPWHSWAVVACGGMSIGHKGMVYAADALAMTMVDLFENPDIITEMKKEFNERKGDAEYKAILPDGPAPIPGN
ncbi:MAG TPA: amidohydrolase [Bacteroidetes bacterium]|nr:amidohydrolase [Bacteroidota bacterium]